MAGFETNGGTVGSDELSPKTFDLSDGEDTLSTVDTVGQCDDQSEVADSECKADISPSSVVRYLRFYGYHADDLQTWTTVAGITDLPEACFRVRIHTELHGHTLYLLECALTPCGRTKPAISWSSMMRLVNLRTSFHDHLKTELGENYDKHFGATPFAHRLAPRGTTNRLHAWFQSLATCMSAGFLSPQLVAYVLEALDVPKISKE